MNDQSLTRRQRLLCAIWEAWKEGRSATLRPLLAGAGYSSLGGGYTTLNALVKRGWLRKARLDGSYRYGVQEQHKYLPGPRFGGIDRATGRPLYIIRDADSEPKEDHRLPKYERSGVLFDREQAAMRLHQP